MFADAEMPMSDTAFLVSIRIPILVQTRFNPRMETNLTSQARGQVDRQSSVFCHMEHWPIVSYANGSNGSA